MKNLYNLDYKEVLGLRTDDPKTNDPTYRHWWETLEGMPLFISYPRTGAHWINAVTELYFDVPRLPIRRSTFLDPDRDDWCWFHDHDTIAWDKLHLRNNTQRFQIPGKVLYLYRDPVDTVFSWIVYNFNQGQSLNFMTLERLNDLVVAVSLQYRDHLTKWLVEYTSLVPRKTVGIRYENFKKDPITEFQKIVEYWEQSDAYNPELAQSCFDIVTPEALTKRRTEPNTLSDFMLTDEYKKERSAFREKYEDQIYSIVLTAKLKGFFE